MRRTALVVLGLFTASLGWISPVRAADPTTLDGTTWSVTVTPDQAARTAGEKPKRDMLSFYRGQFTSTESAKSGFPPSRYATAQSPHSLSFQVEQASKKEGKLTWMGTVAAGRMTGMTTWTKKSGPLAQCSFDGKRVEKP